MEKNKKINHPGERHTHKEKLEELRKQKDSHMALGFRCSSSQRPPLCVYLCLSPPGFHTLRSVDTVLLTVQMLCAYLYQTL